MGKPVSKEVHRKGIEANCPTIINHLYEKNFVVRSACIKSFHRLKNIKLRGF